MCRSGKGKDKERITEPRWIGEFGLLNIDEEELKTAPPPVKQQRPEQATDTKKDNKESSVQSAATQRKKEEPNMYENMPLLVPIGEAPDTANYFNPVLLEHPADENMASTEKESVSILSISTHPIFL